MAKRRDDDSMAPPVRLQGVPVGAYPQRAPEAQRGSVRRVTLVGEPILRRRCRAVTEFSTPELERLVVDMFATMYAAQGVGLAANQVDVNIQLFVWDCADGLGERHVGHIVNPVLETTRRGREVLADGPEGCLSIPGPQVTLPRLESVAMLGVDTAGAPLRIEGQGYFARCLQHELDHLHGRLYIDRLSPRRRANALDKMTTQARTRPGTSRS
jgi:peptide deformylase